MSCGKVCQKLWNNYLDKYGDFREHARIIQNDQQCLMKFRLPQIKQQLSKSTRKSIVADNNGNYPKKCDSSLPPDCCHSSRIKNSLSLILNKSDREKLEKLIEAENFPENIFPSNIESRSSIDNEVELPLTNTLHRLTSPIKSIVRKNTASSYQSIRKSEPVPSSNDLTTNRATNPYRQFIEGLRNTETTKDEKFDVKPIPQSFDSTIDANTHTRIQQFLSFLHSLNNSTDPPLDEHTLINLFSVDNHLSSSIYIPMNIQQLNNVPKSILHSLQTTPENEHILNQIETEISRKIPRRTRNPKQKQSYFKDSFQTLRFVEQDKELDLRLSNTYIIKAFKDYLIQQNKSIRLPKLFHDLETN